MNEAATSSYPHVAFRYEAETIVMWSVSDYDHIINIMRRTNTFYERDVLERIRERLSKRNNMAVAVDVGAFIGTHSIYFAKYCGFRRVLAFEANKITYSVLKKNILANDLQESIVLTNKALGARPGHAIVVPGQDTNQGTASVVYDSNDSDDLIEVTTLDCEISPPEEYPFGISLIKIDVEGAELEVIQGAKDTIKKYEPILCVEVHETKNLLKLLSYLGNSRYWIIDCLGRSPTYILEPAEGPNAQRLVVNFLWLARSAMPRMFRRYLKWLARVAVTGKWKSK